ncbi:Protein dachsous [Amphibalanus amphitrite]|uniref:Protein dachsous n=1 Tax=Amphibalanus amphitrite TaxID=1232801 RepID=A0A6A4XCK8_AMPAM|nr:Protein dachsous [Amphibalanus amphitrite]
MDETFVKTGLLVRGPGTWASHRIIEFVSIRRLVDFTSRRVQFTSEKRRPARPPRPLTVGARPLTVGARPLTVGARPLTVSARPLTAGARPLTVGARPLTVGARPLTVGARPLTVGARPLTVSARPLTVGARPLTAGARPLTVGARPLTAGARPLTVGARPLTVGARPLTVGARPLTVGARPLTVSARPLTVGARPLTAGARPLTVGARPLTVGARPLTSSPLQPPLSSELASIITITTSTTTTPAAARRHRRRWSRRVTPRAAMLAAPPALRRAAPLLLVTLLAAAAGAAAEYVSEFDIAEGVPVGTNVGYIGRTTDGRARPPEPPYLIVPVPGSAVDADLNIDENTGLVRTRVVLDREVRSSYSLVAIPQSGENIRVVIRVTDENDNAPTFPVETMAIEFPENTPRDVKRTLFPARDLDLGVFNTQRYNIVSGNVNDCINGFLDRETTAFYSLVIEALDGGSPPLRGSMTVNITIQDVNDNQPIFNHSVLQVFATDTDSAANGRVTYSINRRQSDHQSNFKIDPNSGVISVNRPLDFESRQVHELVVVARDNGAQPLETTAFVEDASPRIAEDAQPGEFVARISVNDPDTKEEYDNISVNVTLSGGDGHFGLKTHDNIIYLVIVSRPLDRELKPNYTLTCARHRTRTTNDNAPRFEKAEYHTSVLEVADPGTEVLQVTALDSDEGSNSRVHYSLLPGEETHADWFEIDENTGLITTRAHIDCETEPEPRVTVLATDGGSPPLSATGRRARHHPGQRGNKLGPEQIDCQIPTGAWRRRALWADTIPPGFRPRPGRLRSPETDPESRRLTRSLEADPE